MVELTGRPWRVGELSGAMAVLGALTLILTYPISIHPGSTSLGSDPDVHTYTWTLAWDVHAFITRPWAIFDANICEMTPVGRPTRFGARS